MLISLLLGVAIFGYAAWSIYRYVQKSKRGKCASCSLNSVCASGCGEEPHKPANLHMTQGKVQ